MEINLAERPSSGTPSNKIINNTTDAIEVLPAASCSHSDFDSDRPIPEGYYPCCLEEDQAVWQFLWNNDPSDDLIVKTV